MKKVFLIVLTLVLGTIGYAQSKIQFRSVDKAECLKSDYNSLRASFSFSSLDAQKVETTRGEFSEITMLNTVIGGNEGDPQIPVVNELIAVPFGANPVIRITNYSITDYNLDELGIDRLIPRQPSIRKDLKPENVPFLYNEESYQTRGLRSEPKAVVGVEGIMRGVQLGKMTIEPVSYDPSNNTLRVFNDIEVEVSFEGADAKATEEMLVKTYSPYFDIVYKQLFNGRAVLDAYSDHPDLYSTPVKMLVVATQDYQNSTAFQNWLTWKKQKGIYVDIYTVTSSTASSTIRTEIQSRYNSNHPTFLVIVGDETVVKAYKTNWSCNSNYGNCINDLEYASIDSDVYHDMYMSRMSVSSTTELGNLVNKILTYEKYTMSDPSYLDNSLLVAGWDATWTKNVGKPTIQYANNNYYNSAHGINPTVYITTASGQTAAYNNINNVGFLNYTAHGDIQKLADPQFNNSNVSSMTNNDKYLWIVANCCLTANWGNSTYSPCFGETMIRAANKGAFGYIGSIPESYWYEDYYFGVGAFSYVAQTVQTTSSTTTGMYDAAFDDTQFNCLNSMPYIGNVAVTYAHAKNYTSSVTDEYYWRAYQCLGDGSVMPYLKNPSANNVTHSGTLTVGATSYQVKADAGSYVAITVNNEIIGVNVVPSNGTVSVPITAQNVPGTAMIVVTRNQRQPYIGTIQIVGGTQYNITVTQPEHGTISAPAQAYASTQVALTATPETGYCLSSWTVKSGNQSITVTDNSFTMPEHDVTVTATFVVGMQVTLASVMNGTIAAEPEYALQGTTINLTATPASGYAFDSWVVYKTGDLNTSVTVNGNSFTMPNYPVTVSAIFTKITNTDVTAGSGTGTTNGENLPTNVWYKYSLTQQVYTKAEVGDSGNITAISFYYNSSTSSGARTLDIYMAHTTSSTISSWQTQSSSNKVFSGTHNFSQGWNTITLDTPFSYNGTNNLLLTVDDNTGSYSVNSSTYFYTYSTSANRAYYYKSDSNNLSATSSNSTSGSTSQYNSQIKFTKEVSSTEGYLSVSPNSLTGFEAMGGVSASAAQTVSIVGDNLPSNLTVSATSGFEVSTSSNGTYSTSLTLTPSNGSLRQMVYVRLSSNATPGNINGSMTLTSGSTSATVTLSGNVVQGSGTLYTITANANPTAGGTVNGAGSYYEDGTCTLTATANAGYTFANWTKDGSVVSTSATYSFTVSESATYVANFTMNTYTITATANPTEGGTVSGTGSFNLNNTCTLTATANTGYTFTNWTKNGTVVSSNATYSFTVTESAAYVANFTLNSYTVTAAANPAEGGEVSFAAKGNREDLTYDFEDGTQGWTVLKGNSGTSSHNWMHTSAYTAYDSNGNQIVPECHNSSTGMMLSESYISAATSGGTATGAVTPDNYLVSPQIRLGGSITFYACARMSNYPAEKFTVYVSESGNTSVNSFSPTSLTVTLSDNSWHEYTVDLSSYSGMGYVAIRHYDCNDQHLLYIDDITIVEGESHSNGEGNYYYGQSCTVTATANTGYHFVNWTENGTVVSSNANYTFTVTGDTDLVANFSEETPSYTIVVKANPTNAGTVTGGGTFEAGQSCTLTATASTGFTFTNWTKDGSVVSTNSTYTFTVNESADYTANFSKITYTITATANPAEGGTIEGAGVYEDQATPHLIATPNDGYVFINWTENGVEVSTQANYYFTADSNRDLVANFGIAATQIQPILAGWNWFSTYIEMGLNGLALIEQALGTNGIQIKGQNAFVLYENGEWDGNLTVLDNATMYQIQVQNSANLVVNSVLADVEAHPISLHSGWNWIGYPSMETVDVNTALSELNPADNDMVKGRNAYTTYIEGYGWWGTLNALTPGNGYMYKRNGDNASFVYRSGTKFNGVTENNANTYWKAADERYANNASMMVTIDAANLTLSEDVEVGAFVNGECRGAAKLMYVEPTNQYVAFLTVFGNNNDEVSFKVYNNGETFDTDEQVSYTDNMVVGKVTEPFVLHLSFNDNLVLFPNPVEKGQDVTLSLQSGLNLNNVRIDIYNAFGANIRTEHNVNALNGITTTGVYTVKVTDAQGNTYFGKLIVK